MNAPETCFFGVASPLNRVPVSGKPAAGGIPPSWLTFVPSRPSTI